MANTPEPMSHEEAIDMADQLQTLLDTAIETLRQIRAVQVTKYDSYPTEDAWIDAFVDIKGIVESGFRALGLEE
jgi:hypothetical protein